MTIGFPRARQRRLLVLSSCLLVTLGFTGTVKAQSRYSIAVEEAKRLGGRLRIDLLVDSSALGGQELEVAEITFPPGGAATPHRHGATELLYVLEGELNHTVNGTTRRLSPGMVGIVRMGDTVSHGVASAGPARVLVIWTPAGEAARLMAARGPGTTTPVTTVADAVEGLATLRRAWTEAYNAGRVEPLRDLYTPDAVRMPYDARTQSGRDSVIASYERSFSTRVFTPAIKLTPEQIEVRGDLAIERGTYDELLTPKRQGRTLREVGKYVSLVKRGDDGRWRFAWSIFNRDAPAAPQ